MERAVCLSTAQELDSAIVLGPFQLGIFYGTPMMEMMVGPFQHGMLYDNQDGDQPVGPAALPSLPNVTNSPALLLAKDSTEKRERWASRPRFALCGLLCLD